MIDREIQDRLASIHVTDERMPGTPIAGHETVIGVASERLRRHFILLEELDEEWRSQEDRSRRTYKEEDIQCAYLLLCKRNVVRDMLWAIARHMFPESILAFEYIGIREGWRIIGYNERSATPLSTDFCMPSTQVSTAHH